MEVILAEQAGFCFGVDRGMEQVEEWISSGKQVFTYGPMIHNESVLDNLSNRGVRVIHSASELSGEKSGVVVIRSHGVTKAEQAALEKTGLTIVDGTCPYVKKIHNYACKYSEKGYHILIIGDAAHPEIRGICGWVKDGNYSVVNSEEELNKISISQENKVLILVQTTYNLNKFKYLVEKFRKTRYDTIVRNTICTATKERQEAAKELSYLVDAMIVIGGKESSNSRKLFEICSENCVNTYFIQTVQDLKTVDFSRCEKVGITAGASTPNNIIKEVQNYVRNEF